MNVETLPPSPSRLASRWSIGVLALAVAGAVALIALVSPALRSPGFVERLGVYNPHPWHADVDISDGQRQGWVGLGTVARGQTATFHEVADHGDKWVFRFMYAGHDGGELVVERAELEGANWMITVPEGFAARMEEAGVPESAP